MSYPMLVSTPPKQIDFINAPPGGGKTEWIKCQVLKNYKTKKTIAIISAPTHNLLQEYKEWFLTFGIEEKHIFYIEKDSYVPASTRLCIVVNGCEPSALGTENETHNCAAQPGDIILTTYANLWNCELLDVFYRPKMFTLYIDEARSCEVRTANVVLTGRAHINSFLRIFNLDKEEVLEKYSEGYSRFDITNTQLNLVEMYIGPEVRQEFEKVCPLKTSSDVHEVKVCLHVNISETGYKLSVKNVLLPFSLIGRNWKHIYLASAQFESSQFYHLLKMCENQRRLTVTQREYFEELPHIKLNNITTKALDPVRLEALRKRLSSTKIVYLVGNDLSKDRLGAFVTKPGKHSQLNKYSEELKDLLKKLFHKTFYTLSELLVEREFENNVHPVQAKKIRELRDKIRSCLFCYKNTGAPVPALTWLCVWAAKLGKRWVEDERHNCREQEDGSYMLMGLNKTFGSRDTAFDRNKEVYEQVVPNKYKPYIVNISGDQRGLNRYLNYDVVVYFVTTRLDPQTKSMWKCICTTYDPEADVMYNTAMQSVFRCSVRDADATSAPLIIVTCEDNAYGLINRLEGHYKGISKKIEVLNPAELGLPSADCLLVSKVLTSEERKTQQRDRIRKYARKESSKEKAIAYKRTLRVRARKVYFEENCSALYKKRNYITKSICEYKKQGNLEKVAELKTKQKELTEQLKVARKPYEARFKRLWGINEEFTKNLTELVERLERDPKFVEEHAKEVAAREAKYEEEDKRINDDLNEYVHKNIPFKVFSPETTAKARYTYIYLMQGMKEKDKEKNRLRAKIRYCLISDRDEEREVYKQQLSMLNAQYRKKMEDCRVEFAKKWSFDEEFTYAILKVMGK